MASDSSSIRNNSKKEIDHRTLRVSNLPLNVTVSSVFNYFKRSTIPVRIFLHEDKSAAFVEFSSERNAAEALIATAKYYPFLKLTYATKRPNKFNHRNQQQVTTVAKMGPPFRNHYEDARPIRSPAEERRLIQRALEIVYKQRLGDCGNCARCGEITTKQCSNCRTFYCNKECQLIDWNTHQNFCGQSAMEAAPTSLIQGYHGRGPMIGSEAPRTLEGFRQINYRSSHFVEASQTAMASGPESARRFRNDIEAGSSAGNSDKDKKPFRAFNRNFDTDKDSSKGRDKDRDKDKRDGGSKRFSSNKSESSSGNKGRRRDDRKDNRDRSKRFDQKNTVEEPEKEWADSPASPTPEDKENVTPAVNESKPRRSMEKEKEAAQEEESAKKPAKKERKQKEIASMFGLVRESPDSYWVMTADNIDHWQKLQLEIQDICAKAPEIKPSVGLVCGCFFDDMWYRAKIISLKPNIKVHYLDFGNEADYDADFKKLPEDVASLPQLAFLAKFAEGTPENFESKDLDGLTFPVEIVRRTPEYCVIKFVGENYPESAEEEEVEELVEEPKKKETTKKEDSLPEKRSSTGRREERPPERRKPAEKREDRSPEKREPVERRKERSPDRRKPVERREERSPEKKKPFDKKPVEAPKKESAPVAKALKKTVKRENAFDSLDKDVDGCTLIVSRSETSLFGCLVPKCDDKFGEAFEGLDHIKFPKQPFDAEVGDYVLTRHPKGYESRGVVIGKTDDSYLVSLVDYACTVTVKKVYEISEDVKKYPELGVEIVIEKELDDDYLSPSEDTVLLFNVTGNCLDDKWPCTLSSQEKKVVKGYFKKWEPKNEESKGIKSGAVVVISSLISFAKSYVRLVDSAVEKRLSELGEQLQEHAKKANKYRGPPQVGDLCCVPFINDGMYYRAVIDSVNRNIVNVRFIDYGNEQETRIQEVLELSEELKNIPPFAHEILLKGVSECKQCSPLVNYFTRLYEHATELTLTYEGDITNGVTLTERATGVVVNEIAREKIAAARR